MKSQKKSMQDEGNLLPSSDLVRSPVHLVDVFEIVRTGPDVFSLADGSVVDGVVVFFSELWVEKKWR